MRLYFHLHIGSDITPYVAIRRPVLSIKYAGYNFGTESNTFSNTDAEFFFKFSSSMNIARLKVINGDRGHRTHLSLYFMLLCNHSLENVGLIAQSRLPYLYTRFEYCNYTNILEVI